MTGGDAAEALSYDAAPSAVPASSLAERGVFSGLVDRFHAAQGGTDRLASISVWSQLYFARLIIPAVQATVGHGRGLPLGLADMQIAFCPDSGVPTRFYMSPRRTDPAAPPFAPLIDGHLTPLIAVLRRHSGLSVRLLWENAGWYLMWALGEAGRSYPSCRPAVHALLDDETWPREGSNLLQLLKRAARDGAPVSRRTCCLRYRVPGFARCEGICPLFSVADGLSELRLTPEKC